MIAAWMVYSAAITLLLFAGAGALEYVARAIGAPTRLVWAAAMIAAVGLSARAFVAGLENRHEAPPSAAASPELRVVFGTWNAVGAGLPKAAEQAATTPGRLESFVIAARAAAGVIRRSAERIDVGPLDRWNRALVALWLTASFVALLWLAGSLVGLKRIEQALAPAVVDNQRVLVSRDVGPALFGIVRARIVLPGWVIALPKSERDVILAHEREHAAAFDPALVYAAAFVFALQPWNVALWMLFARLRLAIEGDCDRRVLGANGDGRRYARLLVDVYERKMPGLTPYVAFVERRSNLERRVRRITRRPRLISVAGGASALAATVLVTTAWTVAAPVRRDDSSKLVPPTRTVSPTPTPLASRVTPIQAVVKRDIAPAAPVPVAAPELAAVPESVVPVAREERCEIFRHVVADAFADAVHPQAEKKLGFNSLWGDGCSVYGDVVVAALDSSRVLVAVRDTADTWATAFFVFATTPGSVPRNLVWSTKTGRARLSDTTLYFANPEAGAKPVVFRMRRAGIGRRESDTQQFDVLNMVFMQMHGVPWDAIAQLPTAERCTPSDPSEAPRTDREWGKACFLVQGKRIEVPLP